MYILQSSLISFIENLKPIPKHGLVIIGMATRFDPNTVGTYLYRCIAFTQIILNLLFDFIKENRRERNKLF